MNTFKRVGMGTGLVLSMNAAGEVKTGDRLSMTHKKMDDGRVIICVRRDPKGSAVYSIKGRENELRVGKKLKPIRGLPQFGMTDIVGRHTLDDGWDLVVPAERKPVRGGRKPSRPAAAPAQAPQPVPAEADFDSVGKCIRALNEHKRRLGDQLVISILPSGEVEAIARFV